MPYFIQKQDSGWATVKDDGTVLGCIQLRLKRLSRWLLFRWLRKLCLVVS